MNNLTQGSCPSANPSYSHCSQCWTTRKLLQWEDMMLPKYTVVCVVVVPPNLPILPTPLALLSLEATMFMSEGGGISALRCCLEYSACFIIVLQASLEVLREVCAYRYSHEHIYYLQICT